MVQESEKFLEVEESAQKVLEALQRLHTEATAFETSATNLDAVREKLVHLIEETGAVTKDTHEVVKLLKEIGGPEILHSIDLVSQKIEEEKKDTRQQLRQLKIMVVATIVISFAVSGLVIFALFTR